jgi:cytochrome c553
MQYYDYMMDVVTTKYMQDSRSGTLCGFAMAACLFITGADAAGDRALGEYLSSECVTCHRLSGQTQGIPQIVGRPVASFIEIMNEYRQKKRANDIMQTIAGRFSDDELAALAAYFGSLKPGPQIDKTKTQQQRGIK